MELDGARLRAVAELWRRSGREVTTQFGGTSMLPTIPPGVDVVLQCPASPKVGDIIAYVRADRLVVHRVVTLSDTLGWVLTCGDAEVVPDPPITDPTSVIGTVTKVRRDGTLVIPPPAPPSLPRRLGVLACEVALRLNVPLGRRVIRVLRLVTKGRVR
jgi:hypothetical protein